MAKLEMCQECKVRFKHHELVRHRRISGHYKFPLVNVVIKEEIEKQKKIRRKKLDEFIYACVEW